MRNRLLAVTVAALAGLAIAMPASAATTTAKPNDFTNGTIISNIKIESFDHGCLTYAHPVAGSAIGTAPCSGGHNWDYIGSDDGTQYVLRAHGTSLALADSGGSILLESFNTTSDSLFNGPLVVDGNGTAFVETDFDENRAVWIMDTGVTGNVITSSVQSVHDAWNPL